MEQTEPRISVIIPVYNVEKYLARCLESVLNQTFTEFEIVAVVDGSPDSSVLIARSWAGRDSRIRVIEKPVNGGTMEARRTGYENARGEFVVFCDGDDTLPGDALEKMYSLVSQGRDIVFCGLRILRPDGSVKIMPRLRTADASEDLYLALLQQKMTWYLCGGIYRRTLFSEGKLETFGRQCVNEDYMMIIQLLQRTDKIAFYNEPVYDYHLQESSSSQGPQTLDKLHQELRANKWSCDYLCRLGIHPDKARWLYLRRVVKCMPRGFSRRQIFDSGLVDRDLVTLGNIYRYVGPKYVVKYLYWTIVRSLTPASRRPV